MNYTEGVMVYNVNKDGYNKAIEIGKANFFKRYGYPADVVALPTGIDVPTNLPRAATPAPRGSVIVGTSRRDYRQGALL